LLITELDVGGAERCLTNLACGLVSSEYELHVATLAPRPRDDQLVQRLVGAGVAVTHLDLRGGAQWLTAIRRVRDWLGRVEPTALQTFLFHANAIGCLAAGSKIPVATGIRVADPRRWRSWVERWACRRAARIVCVSERVAEFARQRLAVSSDDGRIVEIPNGIAIEPIASGDRSWWSGSADAPLAVYVGRLDRQKGIDWLLSVAGEVCRRCSTCQFVFVGAGSAGEALQRRADELGVADRCHWLGWRQDACDIIASSRLVVLPSRWEGMPNVVLEAMHAARPVVCTRVEGAEQLLGDSPEQLVDFGDDRRLADQLIALLSDDELAASLGSRNRARVSEHFSLRRMIASYDAMYRELTEAAAKVP
jgi:starch synthase (maltosyl-transferring)